VPRGDSSKAVTRDASSETPVVELVLHNPIAAGVEAFNNYGAKPNSELLLGYGFALADNPDDTIILQLGGSTRQWEVGRSHGGSADGDLEGLWEEIVSRVEESTVAADQEDDDEESVAIWESYMDAADMLGEMVEKLLAGLPAIPQPLGDPSCREPIREMIEYYVKGEDSCRVIRSRLTCLILSLRSARYSRLNQGIRHQKKGVGHRDSKGRRSRATI